MMSNIKDIGVSDRDLLSQIARIHIEEVPGGFLTKLGPRVLADMYLTIAQSDGSFLVAIVTSDRKVLGFMACSKGTESLYREFLRHRNLSSIIRLAAALIYPSRIVRIFETLRYSEGGEAEDNLPRAEILNFCVARKGQRKGMGVRLMHAAENIFRDTGIDRVRIVTGHSQKTAQEFYRKFGAQRVGEVEIHQDIPSTMFIWEIGPIQTQDTGK